MQRTETVKPRKEVHKLTIKVVDIEALKAAYPQVVTEQTVVTQIPNRKLLRPIVNALHAIGQSVPGVEEYYAADQQAEHED